MSRASLVLVLVLVHGLGAALSSCFLQVTSGLRREVPPGAYAAAARLLTRDEEVISAWDGSVLQDGALLALLTDERVIVKDGDVVTALALVDVERIIVNEDDGVVDVVSVDGRHVIAPLRTLAERTAFAKLIEGEVRRAKRELRTAPAPIADPAPSSSTPAPPPPPPPSPSSSPPSTPPPTPPSTEGQPAADLPPR